MKIEVKLDETCRETKIIIVAEKMTEEVSSLMRRISQENVQAIVGFNGDDAVLLDCAEIIKVYAAVGKVFATTDKGEFIIRLRLYEVEEKLSGRGFVRISNSELINIKKAKKFDLSTVGTICVSLLNGDISFVSRRYVTKIKKTLGI